MNRRASLIAALCAIGSGIVAAVIDMHNDEVQSAVLVVFVAGSTIGYLVPRHAWRWGVLAGTALTASYLVAILIGVQLRETPQPNVFASAISIVPATIGAYAGVALRAVHNMRSKRTERIEP